MRGLLAFACRAFPPEHRARQSDEIVDTALLAADGSVWCAARESLSLVRAGVRARVRVEPQRSLRDGVALLAGLLALLNLAVALYGISFVVDQPPPVVFSGPRVPGGLGFPNPYVVDWWWIVFAVAASGIVLGLALGNRRLALGAALANLGIVGYDALFLAAHSGGHMNAFAFLRGPDGYPVGQEWLAPAVLLVLATAAAPLGRSLLRLPLMSGAAALLVVLARKDSGGLIFLRWPLAVVVLLAVTLGWLLPRLGVVAIGVSAVLAPYVVEYLSGPPWAYKAPAVSWIAAPGLALGILLPLAYLTLRRPGLVR
jgi:hypothetical protein